MDRSVALPDHCVVCNTAAQGYRLKRKFYYSPAAWKIGASLAPFLALLAGSLLEAPFLTMAFWPLVAIVAVANMFVRKSLRLEVAVCARHRALRRTFLTLSWVCVAGIVLGLFSLGEGPIAAFVLLGALGGLLILSVVQSYVGVQAVRLHELSRDYAWLTGTGEAFRGALPELN